MERVKGIEPSNAAWEAVVLPFELGGLEVDDCIRVASRWATAGGRDVRPPQRSTVAITCAPYRGPANFLVRERRIELCELVPREPQFRPQVASERLTSFDSAPSCDDPSSCCGQRVRILGGEVGIEFEAACPESLKK